MGTHGLDTLHHQLQKAGREIGENKEKNAWATLANMFYNREIDINLLQNDDGTVSMQCGLINKI